MSNPHMDLLAGLTPAESADILALGMPVQVPAGGTLFKLGDPADRMFLVRSGRISLTLPMQIRGTEEDVLVEEKMSGETLGWSGLVPPHRFTLRATAPVAAELLAFPRAALLAWFDAHPTVGYRMTSNVAAVIGHRLGVFQTMWLREMQRVVELRYS